ncbi:MAG: hypothetical protein OXC46_12230 [Thaumarchaeota archaeon]|nr:hypothetical protein [Nitrososphaerota archaeon]
MSHMKDYDTQYGNLMSYKHYTRPEAYRLYGSSSRHKTQHQQNMQDILRIMFENGSCTTWDIAKLKLRTNDVSLIRTKEKGYRRLFLGRYDTKKRSGGMLDLGLVVRENTGSYSRYRLSLHGILYCIDVLNPLEDDFDCMAQRYANILPKVFGRWDEVKSVAGIDAYKMRVLAKGLFLDSSGATGMQGSAPLCEIMSFVHAKYAKMFESISEIDLAEQVSYWFYTFLQYYGNAGPHAKHARVRMDKVKNMLQHDPELSIWYREFYIQSTDYYRDRLDAMTHDDVWIL